MFVSQVRKAGKTMAKTSGSETMQPSSIANRPLLLSYALYVTLELAI